MTTITGRLLNPGGAEPARGIASFVLVDYDDHAIVGFDVADSTEILSSSAVIPAADGSWSVTLTPNASIQLAGGTAATAYRVTETGGAADGTYWIVVPAGGPFWVGTLRTTLVGSTPPSPAANVAIAGALTVGGTLTLDGTAVAAPPGATTKFLAGDGTWRTPAGAVGGVSSFNGLTGDVVAAAFTVGALAVAQNLADVADPATARTNLGLGAAAVRNVGTTSGTVAAGDDSRLAAAVQSSTATAKGDLLAATAAGVVARLGVGPDGDLLAADSSQAAGMGWKVISRDQHAAKLGTVIEPFPIETCNNFTLGLSSGDLISPLGRATARIPITRIAMWLCSAASGSTGPSYVALLDEAGNEVAVSVDVSATFANVANEGKIVELALSSSFVPDLDTGYYPSVLTQFSSIPRIAGCLTANIPAVRNHRPCIFTPGLTSVPSSINIAAANSALAAYWIVAMGDP